MFEILICIVSCVIIIAILILIFVFWNKRKCKKETNDTSIEEELLNNKILNNNIYKPKLKGGDYVELIQQYIESLNTSGKINPELLKNINNTINDSKKLEQLMDELFNDPEVFPQTFLIQIFNKSSITLLYSLFNNYNFENIYIEKRINYKTIASLTLIDNNVFNQTVNIEEINKLDYITSYLYLLSVLLFSDEEEDFIGLQPIDISLYTEISETTEQNHNLTRYKVIEQYNNIFGMIFTDKSFYNIIPNILDENILYTPDNIKLIFNIILEQIQSSEEKMKIDYYFIRKLFTIIDKFINSDIINYTITDIIENKESIIELFKSDTISIDNKLIIVYILSFLQKYISGNEDEFLEIFNNYFNILSENIDFFNQDDTIYFNVLINILTLINYYNGEQLFNMIFGLLNMVEIYNIKDILILLDHILNFLNEDKKEELMAYIYNTAGTINIFVCDFLLENTYIHIEFLESINDYIDNIDILLSFINILKRINIRTIIEKFFNTMMYDENPEIDNKNTEIDQKIELFIATYNEFLQQLLQKTAECLNGSTDNIEQFYKVMKQFLFLLSFVNNYNNSCYELLSIDTGVEYSLNIAEILNIEDITEIISDIEEDNDYKQKIIAIILKYIFNIYEENKNNNILNTLCVPQILGYLIESENKYNISITITLIKIFIDYCYYNGLTEDEENTEHIKALQEAKDYLLMEKTDISLTEEQKENLNKIYQFLGEFAESIFS